MESRYNGNVNPHGSQRRRSAINTCYIAVVQGINSSKRNQNVFPQIRPSYTTRAAPLALRRRSSCLGLICNGKDEQHGRAGPTSGFFLPHHRALIDILKSRIRLAMDDDGLPQSSSKRPHVSLTFSVQLEISGALPFGPNGISSSLL